MNAIFNTEGHISENKYTLIEKKMHSKATYKLLKIFENRKIVHA